jgi:catechol 2,3-dioxygenase-like lactoylglutathione lyase family enzyme
VLGINHTAFRSPDPAGLREFYKQLLGAEAVEGAHDPLRVGGTLLAFFKADGAVGQADAQDRSASCTSLAAPCRRPCTCS